MKTKPTLLFFVSAINSTTKEKEQIASYGVPVGIRSKLFVHDQIEKCDAVGGDVPEVYKDKATIEEFLKRQASMNKVNVSEVAQSAGDLPPVLQTQTQTAGGWQQQQTKK